MSGAAGAASVMAKAGAVAGLVGIKVYKGTEQVTKAFADGAFQKSRLSCEMKGCYGGITGSWLVIEGGPYLDENGDFVPLDLKIRKASQKEIFDKGMTFTKYSHSKFHTEKGLQCTRDCHYC